MTDHRRPIVLAALCLCAFAVNLDVTLVNVTLPRLTLDLGARRCSSASSSTASATASAA